ncbi:MAG: capsular polysaccharide biosynthesis protein [Lachnospiraceae bacterium]|nr:capsular polysaccharide biosynthesis protein [Lachnospiraceae bacterium]
MIDFHCHILPAIDDGSSGIEESIKLLAMERDDGVDRLVLTPHFYAEKDGKGYFNKREKRYMQLLEAMEGAGSGIGDIQVKLGAEVCYFPGCGEADIMDQLCINEGRYLLLEMPFMQWDKNMVSDVEDLIEKRDIRLIIAHIERYFPYQKDMSYWNEVFSMPVIPQMNAGAFIGKWLKRRRSFKLLNQGHEIVLGSDCHNVVSRRPNITSGRREIAAKLGKSFVLTMDKRAEVLFEQL